MISVERSDIDATITCFYVIKCLDFNKNPHVRAFSSFAPNNEE